MNRPASPESSTGSMSETMSDPTPPRVTRQQRRATERAAKKVTTAAAHPFALAAENEELRRSVKGAYGLVHVLVRRLAGIGQRVEIPREEWNSIPPTERLDIAADADGNVTLAVEKREP